MRQGFPAERPRRLRRTAAMRTLVAQTTVRPSNLVLPMFVAEANTEPVPITSMPSVYQHSMDSLRRAAEQAIATGVGGLMLFGVPARRDPVGSGGIDPEGVLNRALGHLREDLGRNAVIMADVCLDEFTDHGHCGVVDARGEVDNDATVELYGQMAVAQAAAGADVVAPSGMMDGQVGVIRSALDAAGHADVSILAYTAKYASAYYGPFREAVDSTLVGDRTTYQQQPGNRTEAVRELRLDLAEGADMVMVKPALAYLDVLSDVAAHSDVPVAAYHVSGEYAQIEAAVERGWLDRERVVLEALTSIRRAGADFVLTYYADYAARLLNRPERKDDSSSAH
ncbi:MAG: porphobilinogen synthase [Ornithinimicrobium sp.]